MENEVYYISLTRGLSGCYIKVEATSEEVAREYANNYFPKCWCSVYDEEHMRSLDEKSRRGVLVGAPIRIVNPERPVILNDSGLYE